MIPELEKKEIDVKNMAEKALRDREILSKLLECLRSKTDVIRFNSFNVLLHISENHPEILYPSWDFFAELLSSSNSYSQYIGIYMIAALTNVDSEGKFENLFDTFYNILRGKKTMTASHVAAVSGRIAGNNPALESRITEKLLHIDRDHAGRQKELVKSYAIQAFDEYFEQSKEKQEIMEFVRKQLTSTSPRTQKAARRFIEKWQHDV
ncbi:MAG: hypothetical protein HXS43_01000 [Theionarchaea archaeon]|nr:hypothetical protein [Theionarchaea archaeon]